QAEDGIRYFHVTGVQTCALPICGRGSTRRICPAMTVAPPRCSSARGTARTSGMLLTVIYARVVAVRSIEKRNRAVPSGRPVDHGSPGHGPERARTADPLLAKQVLSQLSYRPVWRTDSGAVQLGNVPEHAVRVNRET